MSDTPEQRPADINPIDGLWATLALFVKPDDLRLAREFFAEDVAAYGRAVQAAWEEKGIGYGPLTPEQTALVASMAAYGTDAFRQGYAARIAEEQAQPVPELVLTAPTALSA